MDMHEDVAYAWEEFIREAIEESKYREESYSLTNGIDHIDSWENGGKTARRHIKIIMDDGSKVSITIQASK